MQCMATIQTHKNWENAENKWSIECSTTNRTPITHSYHQSLGTIAEKR